MYLDLKARKSQQIVRILEGCQFDGPILQLQGRSSLLSQKVQTDCKYWQVQRKRFADFMEDTYILPIIEVLHSQGISDSSCLGFFLQK